MLHHDVSVAEQVVDVIEQAPDLFVAATSLDAGARAQVVVAGGEPLLAGETNGHPLVALAEDEPVRAARAALLAGAREILRWPDEADRVCAAVRAAAIRRDEPAGARGRVVAVCGARGGLGTSSIAALLAAATAGALVLDLDPAGGQRAFAADSAQIPDPAALVRALDAEAVRVAAVAHAGGASAVHLGVAAEGLDDPAVRGLLRAAGQVAPAVIVDAGRAGSRLARAAVEAADAGVVVTGCDVASVATTRTLLEQVPQVQVVLRRTRYSLSKRDVERALGRRVAAVVAEDPALARARDLGRLPGRGNRTASALTKLATLAAGPAP